MSIVTVDPNKIVFTEISMKEAFRLWCKIHGVYIGLRMDVACWFRKEIIENAYWKYMYKKKNIAPDRISGGTYQITVSLWYLMFLRHPLDNVETYEPMNAVEALFRINGWRKDYLYTLDSTVYRYNTLGNQIAYYILNDKIYKCTYLPPDEVFMALGEDSEVDHNIVIEALLDEYNTSHKTSRVQYLDDILDTEPLFLITNNKLGYDKYRPGENVGDLHDVYGDIVDIRNVFCKLKNGCVIYQVFIPLDANVITVNDGIKIFARAERMILSERHSLHDPRVIDWLIKNGASIRVDNYVLIRWAITSGSNRVWNYLEKRYDVDYKDGTLTIDRQSMMSKK